MILLQTHTKSLLDSALKGTAHGILFSGPEGAGKTYTAHLFAMKKLGLESLEALTKQPYFRVISPVDGTIGIEQIRDLQKFLHLKTPGKDPVRRAVIIKDAHFMTGEAQNALLKSLEEPPADTVVILTAPATRQLKQTIYSRVQQIPVLPVSKKQAAAYFSEQFEAEKIEKAYVISGGHVGLMSALLQSQDHVLLTEIQRAKELLSSTLFNKLAQVDVLCKERETLPMFLYACKLVCSTALHQASGKTNTAQTKHWYQALQAVYAAEAALPHNPNIKLLLTDLVLHV